MDEELYTQLLRDCEQAYTEYERAKERYTLLKLALADANDALRDKRIAQKHLERQERARKAQLAKEESETARRERLLQRAIARGFTEYKQRR